MSNLPTVAANVADLAAAIIGNKVNTSTNAGGIGGFLKFDFSDGNFTFGRDQEQVTGDLVLVNIRTISHGWVLWADGKVQKSYAPFTDALPLPMAPIGGKEPAESRAFQGSFWDDGAPGPTITFETNSHGGRQGVNKLIQEISQQAVKDPQYLFPLIKLSAEGYLNKTYGKTIYNPKFEVVGWATADGVLKGAAAPAIAAPVASAVAAPAPVAAAPAPEPAAAAPEPARRRRVAV